MIAELIEKLIEKYREYQENENFAPKQDKIDCPLINIYFCTLVVTREAVRAFIAEHPEYTKASRFKDIKVKIYI